MRNIIRASSRRFLTTKTTEGRFMNNSCDCKNECKAVKMHHKIRSISQPLPLLGAVVGAIPVGLAEYTTPMGVVIGGLLGFIGGSLVESIIRTAVDPHLDYLDTRCREKN